MGRNPRIHYPGAIYHVMSRGVDGRDIFVNDKDRTEFLNCLTRIGADASAEVLAYCLMGNHFHLAVKIGTTSLAAMMQRVLTGYSQVFNRRHDRNGHLFQARYKAIVCLTDSYLAALVRYIHMNPVRAGLVSRAEDWPWSSLRGEPSRRGPQDDLDGFDPWPNHRIQPMHREESERRSLDELGEIVAAQTGIDRAAMRSGDCRREVIAAKRRLTQDAVASGYQLIEVARWMNSALSSISRYARAKNCKVEGLTPASLQSGKSVSSR